jgi:hypothetical protein
VSLASGTATGRLHAPWRAALIAPPCTVEEIGPLVNSTGATPNTARAQEPQVPRPTSLLSLFAISSALIGAAPALADSQPPPPAPPPGAEAEHGTLSANPGSLSFSPIPYSGPGSHEGEQNESEEVTILNDPTGSTQIESIGISGPDASSYSVQWGNCEHDQLAPSNTCNMSIRFQPVSPGPKHAQITIASDSPSGPLVVALEGVGLYGPRIGLNTDQALLGDVTLGSSATQAIVLTNTGDYPLGVQQAFRVSGTPLMFPILSDTCSGRVVYPSASCAVTVGFDPTTPGEKDASILFITSSSLPVTVVGIDGVGVGVLPAAAQPPPASLFTVAQSPPVPLAKPTTAWSQWHSLRSPGRLYGTGGKTRNRRVERCEAHSRSCRAGRFQPERMRRRFGFRMR